MASSSMPDISKEPILAPPPGQVSNFVSPESRAYAVYVAAGICLPLVVIFAALRFYAKLKLMKRKTWDDFTCALGIAGGIVFMCLTLGAVAGGPYGAHSWDIMIGEFTREQLLVSLLVELLYGPCIWFIKLSLFVLYLEVFGLLKWLRYSAFVGMFLTGVFYFTSMILFAVYCGPKHGQSQFSYLSALGSAQCTETRSMVLAQGIINVISDLYLVLLPLPPIWALQMPMRRKLGVAAMIFTGLIACIASILGLVYRIRLIRSMDNTWKVIPVWVANFVEMTAGLLVCCMPAMTAVLKSSYSRYKSSTAASGSGRSQLLHSRQKAFATSEQTSSTSELQTVVGRIEPAYFARVTASQDIPPNSLDFRNGSSVCQQTESEAKDSPFSFRNIRQVTKIDVV